MSSLYSPLPDEDTLRLITIRPGPFFADLEGDLVPVPFSAKPRYLALSYTWGASTADQFQFPAAFVAGDNGWAPIMPAESISGALDSSSETSQEEITIKINGTTVAIGHNLALALRYLRSPTYPLRLWVDFLCINQADIDERNAQVSIMSWIYSRATAVITWLGLNGRNQKLPLEPEIMSREMEIAYDKGNSKELAGWFAEYVTNSSSASNRNILESRGIEEDELERLETANQFANSMVTKTNYWQRMWVVQEVCLASKVFFVYGPTVFVNEKAVHSAHQALKLKVARGMDKIFEARRFRYFEEMRLERLIEEFMAQKCADPRDKIYGLAGLANDIEIVERLAEDDEDIAVTTRYNGSQNVEFIIDYRRPFYDIWCDVVQYIFRCPYYFVPSHADTDESQIRHLRHVRLTNVVRFAGLVQNTLQDEVESELAQLVTSSEASETGAPLQGPRLFGRHVVPARGYLAGKILDFGPSYANYVGSNRHQTAWRALWRKHYRKESDLMKLRMMEESYAAKILLYNETDVGRITHMKGEPFVAYPRLEHEMLDDLTAANTPNADRLQIIDNLLEKLASHSVSEDTPEGEACRFIGTDCCIGLAPPGAARGDWVIRFWDCDTAVVVRAFDGDETDTNTVLRLIGRADVADISDRKGPHGDTFGNEALQRDYFTFYTPSKIIDMVMDWRTLQRVTASITT